MIITTAQDQREKYMRCHIRCSAQNPAQRGQSPRSSCGGAENKNKHKHKLKNQKVTRNTGGKIAQVEGASDGQATAGKEAETEHDRGTLRGRG